MKKFSGLLFFIFLSASVQAAAPTEESVNRLVDDMHIGGMLDALKPQMTNMMKQTELQARNGKQPSPEEQKVIDKFHAKVIDIIAASLTVEKLKPIYVRIYSQNFTQEEIDGVIAFVESPAGKAYMTKLPGLVQAEMPNMITPAIQDIQAAAKEMCEELADLHKQTAK